MAPPTTFLVSLVTVLGVVGLGSAAPNPGPGSAVHQRSSPPKHNAEACEIAKSEGLIPFNIGCSDEVIESIKNMRMGKDGKGKGKDKRDKPETKLKPVSIIKPHEKHAKRDDMASEMHRRHPEAFKTPEEFCEMAETYNLNFDGCEHHRKRSEDLSDNVRRSPDKKKKKNKFLEEFCKGKNRSILGFPWCEFVLAKRDNEYNEGIPIVGGPEKRKAKGGKAKPMTAAGPEKRGEEKREAKKDSDKKNYKEDPRKVPTRHHG